jgi:hypothetical protein
VVSTFSPVFREKIDPRDVELIFIVPRLASALARLGRWEEADKLFADTLLIWSPKQSANGLNLSANRAVYAFLKGDFAAAVTQMDAVIEDAKRWGGQVHGGALGAMHLHRACALEQLGRGAQDITSKGVVTLRRKIDPTDFAYLQLCRNDLAEARKALMEGLEAEETRSSVLAWIQPDEDRPVDSEFARMLRQRRNQLTADQQLLAAARKYGRVLDRPINSTAPAEQPPASK